MNRDLLRTELRQRLADVLPPELDTDFCMDRWLESYDFKIDICVEKYNEYIRNRKVLGYDTPESLGKFYSRPEVVNFHRIFSLSTLDQNWINEMDNGIIFVEMGLQDPTKAVKSIRVADYASVFFGYCEYFQRMVVEQEKKSGKRSHGICIFDMELMSMLDYANPVAPINRLFESRVNIWMDYYGELLKRVVIVNPPRVVSLLFKMMSLLLPSKFLDRLSIAQKYPDDILKYIEKDAIPIGYGGNKVIQGADEPNGCPAQKHLTKNDYIVEGLIWKDLSTVKHEEYIIKVGEAYVKEMRVTKGETLYYEYSANREYQLYFAQDGNKYLLPYFKLATPVISEAGSIPITENGNVKIEIKNLSKLMKMKLRIALLLL